MRADVTHGPPWDTPSYSKCERAKKSLISASTSRARRSSIPLPLDRFAESFDAPEIPVEKYKADQKKIAKVIAKRFAEAGEPAPAPAAKPAFEKTGENAVVNSGWYKLCTEVQVPEKQDKATGVPPPTKKTMVCLTQVDIRDANSMVLAGKLAARKVDGRPQWEVLAMLPLGFSIPEGAEVHIDKKAPIKLNFTTCDAAGCFAQANLPDAALEDLKGGQEVSYSGMTQGGAASSFRYRLRGSRWPLMATPCPSKPTTRK